MNKKIYILLMVILLTFAGCTGSKSPDVTEDKTQENESKTESQVVTYEMDFMKVFPQTIDFTWIYNGTFDSGKTEMIVNVEEDFSNGSVVLTVEGAYEDMSDGESGETSYLRTFKLSDDNISETNADFDTVILQKPISIGKTWETKWYSRQYGEFVAEAKIVEASSDIVKVEYRPIHPEIDLVPKDYKVRYEFKLGSGIFADEETFVDDYSASIVNIRYDLLKTSLAASDDFLRKYSSGNEVISNLYKNSEYFYNKTYTDSYKWLKAIENKSEANVVNKFASVISEMDRYDPRNVELAYKLLLMYSAEFENKDRLIDIYRQFYYDTIYTLEWDFYDYLIDDYMDYDKLFAFNEENLYFEYNAIEGNQYLEIIQSYLKNNGIGIEFSEGMPYTTSYPTYLFDKVSYLGSDEYKEYLNLDMIDQFNAPYVNDGGMAVGIDQLFKYISMVEEFIEKYPESEYINSDNDPGKGLFSLILTPNYLDNTPSFYNGRYSMDMYKEVTNEIKKYQAYEFTNEIKILIDMLKANDFYLSMDYIDKLVEFGYASDSDLFEFSSQANEYQLQIEEWKSVKKNLRLNDLYNTVYVESLEELMEAIKPFTNIVMKAGDYSLGYTSEEYEYAEVVEGTLIIKDVNNLHITTETETPITILSPNYNYALEFQDVENVVINKLRVGHVFEYCVAGSVYITDSKNVYINNSIVFGCGEWGIEFNKSSSVYIQNSVISDCITYGLKGQDSSNIVVQASIISRNSKNFMYLQNIDTISFDRVKFYDNTEYSYVEGDYGVYLENVENMFFSDSEFYNNGGLDTFDSEVYSLD